MTKWAEGLFLAVKSQLNVTHTCIPGNIVEYDYELQKASVQPAIRKVYQTKDEQGNFLVRDMPIVNSVPVMFPGSGESYAYFPVNVGDSCLLVFSERSLDEWINQGGQVTPLDPRQFHLSDAIAIMGLNPFSNPLPIQNNEDFVISHAGSTVTIKGNGEVDIKTASKIAMGTPTIEVIQQICDLLQSLITNLASGPGPYPGVVTDATTILANLNSIKGTIT